MVVPSNPLMVPPLAGAAPPLGSEAELSKSLAEQMLVPKAVPAPPKSTTPLATLPGTPSTGPFAFPDTPLSPTAPAMPQLPQTPPVCSPSMQPPLSASMLQPTASLLRPSPLQQL